MIELRKILTVGLLLVSTSVENAAETDLDGRLLIGGTLTGGTTKNITPKTK